MRLRVNINQALRNAIFVIHGPIEPLGLLLLVSTYDIREERRLRATGDQLVVRAYIRSQVARPGAWIDTLDELALAI